MPGFVRQGAGRDRRNAAEKIKISTEVSTKIEDGNDKSSSSLPALIYRQLHEAILSAEFKSGQVLRQEELARRFNVSRVPLREALSRLEAEGLIEQRPRRGYAVIVLEPQAIVEIFEMRMVIEEHAGAVAARARTELDIDEIEKILRRMEGLDPASETYMRDWQLLNYEFHGRLVEAGKRKRLAKIARNLRDTVEPYVHVEVSMTGDVREAEQEHREMFEALKAGDAAGLGELSRRHVEDTARRLLAGLRRRALSER